MFARFMLAATLSALVAGGACTLLEPRESDVVGAHRDASTMSDVTTLGCGQGLGCTLGAQVCCQRDDGGTTSDFECQQYPGNCDGGLLRGCDKSADCLTSGDVCCGYRGDGGGIAFTQCTLVDNCACSGPQTECLCDRDTPVCPPGLTCSTRTGSQVYTCRDD